MCLLAVAALSSAGETPAETRMGEEYSRAYYRIEELGTDGDKSGLLKLANDISAEWKPRSMHYYGELVLHLCQVLTSARQNSPLEDIRRIALDAIATYDPLAKQNIAIRTHFSLLGFSEVRPSALLAMTDEDRQILRRAETERLMVLWDRMEATIDPNWDPDELVYRNVQPPPGVDHPAGVAPEVITDPVLRAQYEKAIEENDRKVKRRNEQKSLREMRPSVIRSLAAYCAGAYGATPQDDAWLESVLARHVSDPEVRSQIMKAVQDRRHADEPAPK